jgi:hypothetical protein
MEGNCPSVLFNDGEEPLVQCHVRSDFTGVRSRPDPPDEFEPDPEIEAEVLKRLRDMGYIT